MVCLGFLRMVTAASAIISSPSSSSSSSTTPRTATTTTNPTTSTSPSINTHTHTPNNPTSSSIDDYLEAMRIKSPLIHSFPMSSLSENSPPIYLKLDALQPSGSFKDRGMATLIHTLKQKGAKRLISSSGGNAGHSAAFCGRVVGLPVRVIVPTTTKALMLDKIRAQGAEVEVHGDNWNAADALARKLVDEDPSAAYIPPYDHPLLWNGHSTLIDELVEACPVRPAAIVASVGGGGLLCGIYEGLLRHNWHDVQVIATETDGAASFAAAYQAKKIVRLPSISTLATSLGALEVTPQTLTHAHTHPTTSVVVSDAEAVSACRRFLSDHRLLVEPACGAALALGYSLKYRDLLIDAARNTQAHTHTHTHTDGSGEEERQRPIVIVVCGGSGITPEILKEMEKEVGLI